MSARATALAVALGALAASGFFLLVLEYAPLPRSWGLFLASVAVLAGLFWVSLVLGLALLALLGAQELARRGARARPS